MNDSNRLNGPKTYWFESYIAFDIEDLLFRALACLFRFRQEMATESERFPKVKCFGPYKWRWNDGVTFLFAFISFSGRLGSLPARLKSNLGLGTVCRFEMDFWSRRVFCSFRWCQSIKIETRIAEQFLPDSEGILNVRKSLAALFSDAQTRGREEAQHQQKNYRIILRRLIALHPQKN